MSQDLECPYCEALLEINHDDGFGYEQNVNHEMECNKCGKTFLFETEVSYNYTPRKADCLNGEEHRYKITNTHPECCSTMRCVSCNKERDLTEEEREEYNIETKEDYINRIKNK